MSVERHAVVVPPLAKHAGGTVPPVPWGPCPALSGEAVDLKAKKPKALSEA